MTRARDERRAEGLAIHPIEQRYLLISPIPVHVEPAGVFADRLWRHDLVRHLDYLRDFTLLAPRAVGPPPPDFERVVAPEGSHLRVVPIANLQSVSGAVRALPALLATLWREVGAASIVHSGVAGWPISLGWLANPIALARKRHLVIVVESAFWRIAPGSPSTWKARLRSAISESLARFFCRRAELCFFSQPGYRDSLWKAGRGDAYVTPAVWINDEDILGDGEATRGWESKLGEEARFLFAGRLVADKGVDRLLDALRQLDLAGQSFRVDVIGEGPLQGACAETARTLRSMKMSLLAPVPYGAPFFELLRRYHAVVIPSVSDEQPRLVYDAFAQGVPVFASRTAGLAASIADGENGELFPPGDAGALAQSLARAAGDRAALRRLGLRALRDARGNTHAEMHRARWRILQERFGA